MLGERRWGGLDRLAGIVLLLAATIVAGFKLPAEIRQLQQRGHSARSVPTVGGIPAVRGLPASTPSFLLEVRRIVPERGRFRILVGADRSCEIGPPALFWFTYQLLPRAAVCDAGARWWLLYRAGQVSLPVGARIVAGDGRDFRLVELSGP